MADQDVVRNLKRCFVGLKENIDGDVRVGVFFYKDLVKCVINQRPIRTEQNVPCPPLSFAVFFLHRREGEPRAGF